MIIIGIIVIIILLNIGIEIARLSEVLKPISEYFYKKQRKQL